MPDVPPLLQAAGSISEFRWFYSSALKILLLQMSFRGFCLVFNILSYFVQEALLSFIKKAFSLCEDRRNRKMSEKRAWVADDGENHSRARKMAGRKAGRQPQELQKTAGSKRTCGRLLNREMYFWRRRTSYLLCRKYRQKFVRTIWRNNKKVYRWMYNRRRRLSYNFYSIFRVMQECTLERANTISVLF